MKDDIIARLGINAQDITTIFDTIDDLRKTVPGMVIGKAVKDFAFSIDNKTKQRFKNGSSKVMSVFMYKSLEYDNYNNKCIEPSEYKFKDHYRPYTGQDLTNKKLLVWRSGGIGDLLFIQPNLIHLKKKYPTSEIIFSCSSGYFPLVDNWKCIDGITTLPIDFNLFSKFDYHLTFEGVIERCKQAETTNAYEIFSKWMGLDLPPTELVPKLYTKSKNNEIIKNTLNKLNIEFGKYIVIQLRTSSPIRTPSVELWKKVFTYLLEHNQTLVITDKPEMKNQIDKFINLVIPTKYRDNVINFSPYSSSIDLSISLANFSKCVIAPDSSLIHIAAALNKPSLGIYAPFPGEIRMKHYPNSDWIEPQKDNFEICEYGGRKCCLHGHKPCPFNQKGTSPCFDNIDIDILNEKLKTLISNERG